jgi:putative membrane protein
MRDASHPVDAPRPDWIGAGHLRTVGPVTSLPAARGPVPSSSWRRTLPSLLHGALIGLVELVPGVSGGTMALVLGIYDRLIHSADHAVQSVTAIARGRGWAAARTHLRAIDLKLVLPLVLGMALALFSLAGPLHTFVETQPVIARALFLGMVLASLLVPVSMIGELRRPGNAHLVLDAAVVIVIAAAVFLLLGIPALQVEEPRWWVLVLSGAAAVCALVLPGLSGSFILLTVGMYEPTLEAASTRDLGYLALFAGGAILGLATVVRGLAYLLREHRLPTLLVATGLILGSARAIWPWQDGTTLLSPEPGTWPVPLIAALAGAAVVVLLWMRDRRARIIHL